MRKVPFTTLESRIAGVVLVTLTEGAAVYWWLRLQPEDLLLAFVVLWVGETLETIWVAAPLRRAQTPIPVGDPFGARLHRRRFAQRFFLASVFELLIWAAWLWLATDVDLPLVGVGLDEPWIGGAVLLVLMHLKHQLEASTLLDVGYFTGFWQGTAASAAEVAGAVGCLALIEDDQPWLAASALAAGFLIEHTLLMRRLFRAVSDRDVSVPRPRRPPQRWTFRIFEFVGKRFRWFWRLLQSVGPVERFLNRRAIDGVAKQVSPRPNPFSTKASYTSWSSLTDRTWSGRYLPPAAGPSLPHVNDVVALFRRDGEMEPCPKSTVLFPSFAQWFVDGFLRTERTKGNKIRDTRRNESGHDIDLAQLYGLNPKMTRALRTRKGGRLRSQTINGEEYPEFLCRRHGRIKRRYRVLPEPVGFKDMEGRRKRKLFAMGTDVHSLGFTAFNVLFLREHNRVAQELQLANPKWSDKRLFETTRNILIVILIKVVVEDYINHIAGYHFQFRFPAPATFAKAVWFRQNWMSVEFNLLYRWHPLIPRTVRVGDTHLTVKRMLVANDVLIANGLRQFMLDASEQPAGRVSLFNTDPELVKDADVPSLLQGRRAKLRSYNDYRELANLPRLRSFSEFSTDERVGQRLHALYDHVDDVEFYVGLFAEEQGMYETLPRLMLTLVAFDAFSQALTNPLLAPRVYGPATFTPIGMQIIESTDSIASIIRRNVPFAEADDYFSLTRKDYTGA